jgi:outer membrane biosynthesis protein TonB
MGKTRSFSPWWKVVAVSLLLFAFIILLSACGGETEVAVEPTVAAPVEAAATSAPTSAPTDPPPPTDPPAPTSVPTEPPTATDLPTEPPPTSTPEPTEEPTPEMVDDSGCVACHTDEETLKAVAVEPEAVEALSEGEG